MNLNDNFRLIFFASLLSVCLICGWSTRSQAQNYRNALTVDPLGLLFSNSSLQYESSISGENSFTARIDFLFTKIQGYSVSAFGLGGSYRWYLPPYRAIDGLWVGPALDLIFLKWKYEKEVISATFIHISGEVGYKFFFEQIVVEPNFKLLFSVGSAKSSGTINQVELDYGDGIGYGFGLSVGYSW